jgi:hypothetical protein
MLSIPAMKRAAARRRAGAVPWWLSGGIDPANARIVYDPENSADISASYVNLANPGTYNAAPGNAPTLSADGWVMASGKYLLTGLVPPCNGHWSAIAWYKDWQINTNNQYVFWVYHYWSNRRFGMGVPNLSPAHRNYANGGGASQNVGGAFVSYAYNTGTIAMIGSQGYHNGAKDGTGVVGNGSGTPTAQLAIGASSHDLYGYGGWMQGTLQGIAFYDTQITQAQLAAVLAARAAL